MEDTNEQLLYQVFMKVEEQVLTRVMNIIIFIIQQGQSHCPREEIARIESRYFPNNSPYGLFRQLRYTNTMFTNT